MAHIYEVNATVANEAKPAFERLLNSGSLESTLDLPGCFFTECRVFERTSDDAEAVANAAKWTIQFFSKSADGIDHYLRHHAATTRQVLNPFLEHASFTRRTYKLSKQVHPLRGARVRTSDDPNAMPEAKLLGSSRRPVTADAFEGALGNKSNHAEFATNRYTDFRPHLSKVEQEFADSKRISKNHENGTRFFQEGDRHKAAPRHSPTELGIPSAVVGSRDEVNRFFNDTRHFGSVDPLRASVENPDGSNVVAGVPTAKAPHEVDRFDQPRKHHGSINPLRESVVNPDGSQTVAGVPAAMAPHEIDRFDQPRKHHGSIDPLRESVVNPDGSQTVAGVPTAKAPHEVDRFDQPRKHHGSIDPLRESVVNPDGSQQVAGVPTSKEPHEIDRFDQPRQRYGSGTAGKNFQPTQTLAPTQDSANLPMLPNARPLLKSRQAPGGNSTFTFG